MGAGISQEKINRKLRYLKKKNPNQQYVILKASNGEVAIMTKEWVDYCNLTTPLKLQEKREKEGRDKAMMSLEQIAAESRKAARKAAREGKRPYLFEEEDRKHFPPFPFPNIGDYRPRGWELIGSNFVDSSGFGAPGEAALTTDQFIKTLKPGFGYAIIEAGEFQVYVGEFKQV